VAVIGSGPAGLSCSDFLNRLGYSVHVYEKDAHPGGLLHYGIPAFKLNRDIVTRRIRSLEERGVNFYCNRELGKELEIEQLKSDGFKAFFLGIGAKRQIDIPQVEGRGLAGITTAYEYLTEEKGHSLKGIDVKGRRVLVLGGGDTAMDCARTAVRKGALKVTCIYRESEALRPGSLREYEAALEEGVKMVDAYSPLRFIGGEEGRLEAVQFLGIDSSRTDKKGRALFREIAGTEKSFEGDVAIISFGFLPEIPAFLENDGIEGDRKNRVKIGKGLMKNIDGVFSGGDMVRGASLAVYALRDGRDAALAIDGYLRTNKT
jgi:glutamate synthase (NADPH/NADH) small chain